MEPRKIVAGQFVPEEKRAFSRLLRKGMTPAERQLWDQLRSRRCEGFKFRRQQVIDGFIADFYCAETGLVIELDGPIHERQAEYDADRDAVLQLRKLSFLRIPNERVFRELDAVMYEIASICRSSTIVV